MIQVHPLRMPLNPHDPARRGFQCLDRGVGSDAGCDQAFTETFDALMVHRVDLHLGPVVTGVNGRARHKVHAVHGAVFVLRGRLEIVLDVGRPRSCDVLTEGATQCNVQQLRPPAYPQNRYVSRYRRSHQRTLDIVAGDVDLGATSAIVLSVAIRGDVAAAGQEQTIRYAEEILDPFNRIEDRRGV